MSPSDPLDPLDPSQPQQKKDNLPAYETLDDAQRPAAATPTESELESQIPGGVSAVHDPYAAWQFANFRYYTVGSFAWWIGRQMLGVVVGWQVYALTNSMFALGLVGLLEAIPLIVLALPAGHLADRFNRKTITLLSMSCIALCSISLGVVSHAAIRIPESPIFGYANQLLERMALAMNESNIGDNAVHFTNPVIPILYLLFFLTGVAQAFGGPARSALLPSIIPIEHFSNATTWNSSIAQISSMGGPALGGLLMWVFAGKDYNFSAIYFLESMCICIYVAAVFAITYKHIPRVRKESAYKNVIAGVKFVFQKKIILATLSLDMFAVLLGGAVMLLPVYAKDILHVGPLGFGWLRAAPAIGAFVMALAIAHLPPMKKAGSMMLWSVAGFGVATVVFGFSTSFWLSMIALILTGAFDNVSVVVRHTLVQVLTPDSMRGRVSAVNNIFIGSSNELGAFRAGSTAAAFGPIASVVGGGICTLLVVAGVAAFWPEVRRFGSLKDAKPLEESQA